MLKLRRASKHTDNLLSNLESLLLKLSTPRFTPLEIIRRCSAAGFGFIIVPAGFNAPLGFES